MIKRLIQKLNPFGNKEEIFLSDSEKEGIQTLIVMYPELWMPLKKVMYSRMNLYTRKLVTASGEEIIKLQSRIIELDSLIADLIDIKKKAGLDNAQQHRSLEPSTQKIHNAKQPEDKNVIMEYIMSNDIRDKSGKPRLSA